MLNQLFHTSRVVVLILVLCLSQKASSQGEVKFVHVSEGLSQKNVLSIAQDQDGYLWFATRNGLNKYNGSDFKLYQHNLWDSTTINHSYVWKVLCDDENRVWTCSKGGVNVYNQELDNFKQVTVPDDFMPDQTSMDMIQTVNGEYWFTSVSGVFKYDKAKERIVRCESFDATAKHKLFQDDKNQLWVTAPNEILMLDLKTKHVERVVLPRRKHESFDFRDIVQDKYGRLFVASWTEGVFRIKKVGDHFILERFVEEDQLPQRSVRSLLIDHKNQLWVATESFGTYQVNLKSKNVTQYFYDIKDPLSLNSNSVWSLFEDSDYRLWFGLYDKGLDVIDPYRDKFEHYKNNPSDSTSLSGNSVLCFEEDEKGNFWIGVDGGGLNYWDRKSNTFTHHFYDPDQKGQGTNYSILRTVMSTDGYLWMGTWGSGLIRMNPQTLEYTKFTHSLGDSTTIGGNTAFAFKEDPQNPGSFWIAVWQRGLDYYDATTGQFTHYRMTDQESKEGINHDLYVDLVIDEEGYIWLAGTHGIEKIKVTKEGELDVQLFRNGEDEFVLSDNNVSYLFLDQKGDLWACTDNGLDRYRREYNDFVPYSIAHGFSDNIITSLSEDDEGNLWVSTNKGLSELSFKEVPGGSEIIIKNYDVSDGLQTGAFNQRAVYKSSTGELLFGGVEGFNVFDPDSIQDSDLQPHLYFTNFKLFNTDVLPHDSTRILSKHISKTNSITLQHKQNAFTLEWIGLTLTNADHNIYAYTLEGFEDQWNIVGNKHEATYTSLSPGEYLFKVRVANCDGIWTDQTAQIQITVLPPWWGTWWFRTSAFVVIALLLFTVYRIRVAFLYRQRKNLLSQVKERTREVMAKNNELQSNKEELETAYSELEVHNRHITSSIEYASFIQNAMIKTEEQLKEHFPESFILFRPRDVVSGDFYWFRELGDKVLVCACDCTGHGVPGALISMLGMNLLDQIVDDGIHEPARILEKLHVGIVESLNQVDTHNMDGMDLTLVAIDEKKKVIDFAGAKNPLVYIEDGELKKVKADRMSIGGHNEGDEVELEFDQYKLDYTNMSSLEIYLFSDGYQDQFGHNGKKFMVKKFREVIHGCHMESMTSQVDKLSGELDAWQGGADQTDDILVIGIKIV